MPRSQSDISLILLVFICILVSAVILQVAVFRCQVSVSHTEDLQLVNKPVPETDHNEIAGIYLSLSDLTPEHYLYFDTCMEPLIVPNMETR